MTAVFHWSVEEPVNAMGDTGLDHVRVRQDNGRDQQAEVFFWVVDWRERSVILSAFTAEEQQARRRSIY